jgi:hypothetical protein
MHEFLKYVKLYTDCDDYAIKRLEPLLEKYISRPKIVIKEKIVQVVKYHKFKEEPNKTIKDFFDEYKFYNKVLLEDIKKRCRSVETRTKRNNFIRSAISNGYGPSEIGRFLNMDHSTIINVIKKSKV